MRYGTVAIAPELAAELDVVGPIHDEGGPQPMKTDQAVYAFLSTGAEAFRVLTGGLRLHGPYSFRSVTFKAIERRADGVFEPEGHAAPVYVVEFQAQPNPAAWYNLLTKVGLIGEADPARDVYGLLVFLNERDEPGLPSGIGTTDPPFKRVYLNRFLPQLLEREPDNPYVAVFAPLVIERDEDLRAQAPRLWHAVQSAVLPEPVRITLSEVLEYWFFERFRNLTAREIYAMLSRLTPLEETRAYQDIFAEGEAEGEARGEAKGEARGEAKGKADSLTILLGQRFGPLPEWVRERIATASVEQIDAWLRGLLAAPDLEALIGTVTSDGH